MERDIFSTAERGQAARPFWPEVIGPQRGGEEPQTVRLAIGLFTEVEALAKTLSLLAARSDKARRLCLVAPSLPLPVEVEDGTAACTLGASEDLFCRDCCLSCLSERERQRLETHVRDGGFVLIVSSGTPAEQDESCRILLRHSHHGVQTHDFTLRRPTAL